MPFAHFFSCADLQLRFIYLLLHFLKASLAEPKLVGWGPWAYLTRVWTIGLAPGVAGVLLFDILVVAAALLVTNLANIKIL